MTHDTIVYLSMFCLYHLTIIIYLGIKVIKVIKRTLKTWIMIYFSRWNHLSNVNWRVFIGFFKITLCTSISSILKCFQSCMPAFDKYIWRHCKDSKAIALLTLIGENIDSSSSSLDTLKELSGSKLVLFWMILSTIILSSNG